MKTITTTKVIGMLLLVVLSTSLAKAQNEAYLNQDLKVGPKTSTFNLGGTENSEWDFSKSVPEAKYNPKVLNNSLDENNGRYDSDRYYPRKGTQSFVNIYVGLNNYLQDGDLPSSDALFTLNPLTSWYAALNFDHATRILGPLYLDWGIGASIQDLSFENTRVEMIVDRANKSVDFVERMDRVGKKSKINMMHLNVHLVPTFSFGKYNSFRIGAGVYAGYRISSHTKYKYDDLNGDGQKD